MDEISEREKLTPEALEEFMEQTYLDENLIATYIYSIEKEMNGSLQIFLDMAEYEGSVEELEKEILNELKVDSFNTDEIFEKIPSGYRNYVLDLGQKFTELRNSGATISEELFYNLIQPLNDTVTQKSKELARSLHNYDLSLIPPSMYSKIKHINLANFENTRAKLDFNELEYPQKIVGSLKGCSLLSFDFLKYSSHESEDTYKGFGFFEFEDVTEDFLDVENYQVIIDAYRKRGYGEIPGFLFKDAQIQKDNRWYFLDSFEDLKKSSNEELVAFSSTSNEFIKKFSLLVPEEQAQYVDMLIENNISFHSLSHYSSFFSMLSDKKYVDVFMTKIFETNPSKNGYELDNFLNVIDVNILEKYREKMRENKWFSNTREYISKVWSKLSSEIIFSEFDEIYNDLMKEYNDKEVSALEGIFRSVNQEKRKSISQYIVDNYLKNRDINSIYDASYYLNVLLRIDEDVAINLMLQNPEKLLDATVNNYADSYNNLKKLLNKMDSKNQKIVSEVLLEIFDKQYIENGRIYEKSCLEHSYYIQLLKTINNKVALEYISENLNLVLENLGNSTFSDLNEIFKNVEDKDKKNLYNTLISAFDNFNDKERIEALNKNFMTLLETTGTQDDIDKFLIEYKEEILKSLWVVKGNKLESFNSDIIQEYDSNLIKEIVLLEKKGTITSENSKALIENLPNLGVELIQKVYNSNSEMIRTNFENIIDSISTLNKEDATKVVEKMENIFSQSNVPDFFKLYKYYDMTVDGKKNLTNRVLRKESIISPVLTATSSEKLYKKIILSDLMKISIDSNNKSMQDFIRTLDEGNRVYSKISRQNFDENILTSTERGLLQKYISVLYVLYEDSDSYKYDSERGRKIPFTGNLAQDAKKLGSRYCHDGITDNLADIVLGAYIGPYKEPFAEFCTVSGMKKYMEDRVKASNDRHKELAKYPISIQEGDLVKGVGGDIKIYKSVLTDGIRAGEFLGVAHHTDSTPLDTDFAVVGRIEDGKIEPSAIIDNTEASGYGSNFYAVVKYDPNKIELTRSNGAINASITDDNVASRVENINERGEIYRRLRRKNIGYEDKKLEMFSSGVVGEKHYGVRTGVGISDIDYFLTQKYDKRMGYEQAMSGMYIPIYDMSGNLLFSPEMFDEYRKQMQGLPYYDTPRFEVANTVFLTQTKEIVDELFPNEHQRFSASEFEADKKRNAIQRKVNEAVASLGLGMEYGVADKVTNGFVEFIDTGSTGRGTNLPHDGDFDFMMKVDKVIMNDPQKLEELKEVLREKLITEKSKKADNEERTEAGGNFRYKNIAIEGLEEPVDIDITFVSKDDSLAYSTDMCVRERLNEIKKHDFEAYKYVIGNIVLAKQTLKKEGCYKKYSSPGATELGGFGGVGVENWILQNEGSFAQALDTFLEAADRAYEKANAAKNNVVVLKENPEEQKAKDLEVEYGMFMEMYPIFDFGENHIARGNYQHDSFIRGMTQEGYERAKTLFREMRKELEVIPRKEKVEETRFSESFEGALNEAVSQTRSTDVMKTIDGIEKTYQQEINQNNDNEIGG